jgi:mRNA interferase HigB
VRILAPRTLREFWQKPGRHDAEASLRAWTAETEKANWRSMNEVKQQFGNASIVGNDRVVFNIKGNDYRLVVAINFKFQIVYILFIGTHKEYDKIDVKTI